MARDLFAGNNARLKTMKAEDFADAMMADLVHGFNPRTGELAEQRIRRMADKYNSKQLVFLNDKMDALEVFDALDIPEEIFEGDMPTQEEKIAFVEEIKQFTEKSYAFYFPPSDKIIIFAERIPSHREEETFFHENIHAILRSWYGASTAPRRIAEAFWDLAPNEGGEVSKSYIEKKYRDTPEKWKEEFFVTWLGRAMAHGSVDEVTNLLQVSGDKSRIESIEHSLGYDRGEETAARGEGARTTSAVSENKGEPAKVLQGTSDSGRLRGIIQEYHGKENTRTAARGEGARRTEEDTSRGSQEDGKILQGQRYNRLTSSSDGVPRYQFVGERGARQADLAEERTHRIDNLTVAREMEDAGKNAAAIKLATGWERGGDGKWRYEIPDIDRETVVKGLREPIKAHRKAVNDMERQEDRLQGQAFSVSYKIPKRLDSRFTEEEKAKYRQMREKAAALEGEALSVRKEINALKDKVEKEGYETTLGDVLGKDSELIKAYPSLEDVHVKVYERAQRGEGSYNSETNTIKLSAAHRSLDSIYSTMLHEIQHAIQHIEGFARGGNLGTVLSDNAYLMNYRDNLLGTLMEVEKQLKETRDQLAAQDFSRYTKEALTSREAKLQLDALNINRTLDDIDNNRISLDVADRYYRRLGGEVEARNVQRRRGYSEEERRRSLAVATEDVDRDEQHFLFGEDESKSTVDNNREGETLFAERDDKRQGGVPESPARELAEKLNLGDRIEFVIDTNTLTDTNADNERRMRRSKGFFDMNTGKIIIVLPNHTSEDDVLRTVLHESVAHYGLRELFEDDFDTFLDNVYNNVPLEIKARIRDYQARRKCNLHEATEEYLASLAEDTNFEQAEKTGVWPTIKRLLITLLRSAHVRLPKALSDEDLRYILWRSFDNLRTKGRPNIIDRARDITMQSRLGVRNFTSGQNNTSQNRLFRDTDELLSDAKVL